MLGERFAVRYGVVLAIILLGLIALIVAILRTKKRIRGPQPTRSVWDTVLLWPLLLDQPARRERVARGGRFFTPRERIAGIALLVIGVLAVALTG